MMLYRILLSFLLLPVVLLLLVRIFRGHENWIQIMQRLGLLFTEAVNKEAVIWLHAASLGELNSALFFIDKLTYCMPHAQILITCNSTSGVQQAQLLGYDAQLAPLDYRWALSKFRRSHKLIAHIIIESEFWPNRINLLHKKVPIIVLGARMSSSSAKSWSWLKSLSKTTFGKISFLSAQDKVSLNHLKSLGLKSGCTGPILNLKGLFRTRHASLSRSQRANTCLAASTHPGEENIILDAFVMAKDYWPELRIIIAPRHPERSTKIGNEIIKRKLTFVTRTSDQPFIREHHDVFLADTLGEMDLWYSQAGICILGGTFGHYGGHTPYEPAAYGCSLIHGPDLGNFMQEFHELATHNATFVCIDTQQLKKAILSIKSEVKQEYHAALAQNALQPAANFDQLLRTVMAVIKGKS